MKVRLEHAVYIRGVRMYLGVLLRRVLCMHMYVDFCLTIFVRVCVCFRGYICASLLMYAHAHICEHMPKLCLCARARVLVCFRQCVM